MSVLEQIQRARIVVVGDFMLDVYTVGEVRRISPEAPVPVLQVSHETRRPGGAGNAVLNLISLGMEVVAIGRVGDDAGGHAFLEMVSKEGVFTEGIEVDSDFQTPLKNRMIAENQQILRVDYEAPRPISFELEQKFASRFPFLFQGADAVAVSDYAKGCLTPRLLKEIILHARARDIPVIVDPKGMDFKRYGGATILKPNVSEARAAAGLGMEASLDEVGDKILKEIEIEKLVVTRSKEGITLFERKARRRDFPVAVHEVRDVTGAGDTVLAVMTAALANQVEMDKSLHLANLAAGIAIERMGCARISLSDLSNRLAELRHLII